MLAEALRAEVPDYIARFADERDPDGRRLVVGNGSHEPREVLTSAGAIEVKAPRVNDRRSGLDERRRADAAMAADGPVRRIALLDGGAAGLVQGPDEPGRY